MSSVKRKALESKLNRRVRARRDESEELVEESDNDSASPSEEGASRTEDDENATGDESGSEQQAVSFIRLVTKTMSLTSSRAMRKGLNQMTIQSQTKQEPSPLAH